MRPPLLRLRLLSQTLERERAFIVPVAIAVFLGTLLTVFNPLLHREVIDRVVERDPKVLAVLVVMFGVQAVAVANSHTLSLLVARFNYSAVETLRLCAFDSTICGKVFGEQVTSAGEAYTVIMTDTDRIASFLRQTLPGLLGSLVTFLGTIVGMTYLDPGLLPWAILPVPVQFFVYRYRGQIGEKLSRRSRELSGTLNNVTQELLNSRLEIKTAQGERWAIDRFGGTLREALTQYMKATRFGVNLEAWSSAINVGALAALFSIGVAKVYSSQMTIGTLSAFIAYQSRLVQPFLVAWRAIVSWREVQPSLERVTDLLRTPETSPQIHLPERPDEVVVEGVSVSGGPGRSDRLHHASCEIPKGAIVGLVGPNGSGKTSLCLATAGLLRPYEGQINVSGYGIENHDWSRTFPDVQMVPQGARVFSTTVRENTCLDLSVGDEALQRILQDIGLYDVVAALPGNLDANLVEHISTLSGGEIQRLLLARALARSPKLLILDEALSGIAVDDLDLVFAALRKNICERGGRIMISFHSPHMIPYCDFVVELNGAAGAPKLGGEPGDSSRGGTR